MKHTSLLIAGLVVAGICVGRLSAQVEFDAYTHKISSAMKGVNGRTFAEIPTIVNEAAGDETKTRLLCNYMTLAGKGDRDYLAQQMQIAQNQKIISLLQAQQKGDKKPAKP